MQPTSIKLNDFETSLSESLDVENRNKINCSNELITEIFRHLDTESPGKILLNRSLCVLANRFLITHKEEFFKSKEIFKLKNFLTLLSENVEISKKEKFIKYRESIESLKISEFDDSRQEEIASDVYGLMNDLNKDELNQLESISIENKPKFLDDVFFSLKWYLGEKERAILINHSEELAKQGNFHGAQQIIEKIECRYRSNALQGVFNILYHAKNFHGAIYIGDCMEEKQKKQNLWRVFLCALEVKIDRAIQLVEELDDNELKERALGNIALILERSNNFDRMIEFFNRMENNEKGGKNILLQAFSRELAQSDKLEGAIKFFDAIEQQKKSSNPKWVGRFKATQVNTMLKLGEAGDISGVIELINLIIDLEFKKYVEFLLPLELGKSGCINQVIEFLDQNQNESFTSAIKDSILLALVSASAKKGDTESFDLFVNKIADDEKKQEARLIELQGSSTDDRHAPSNREDGPSICINHFNHEF